MSKYSRDDYFAAASAQDLFANFEDFYSQKSCDECGAIRDVFKDLWNLAEKLRTKEMDYLDTTFLAVQIGCQKAGL
jgi:NADH:ubiquinone oxidoreductase subunit F (NADH-binding)